MRDRCARVLRQFPENHVRFRGLGNAASRPFSISFSEPMPAGTATLLLLWLAVLMLMLPLATYGLVGIMSAMMEPPTGYQAWAFCATFIAPIGGSGPCADRAAADQAGRKMGLCRPPRALPGAWVFLRPILGG